MEIPWLRSVSPAEVVGAASKDRPHPSPAAEPVALLPLTAALVLLYLLLSAVSGKLSGLVDASGAFWLPVGLLLASTLAYGYRAAPGAFIGQLAYELMLGSGSLGPALLLATGDLLSVVAVVLLTRQGQSVGAQPHLQAAAAPDRFDALAHPAAFLKTVGAMVVGATLNSVFGTSVYGPEASRPFTEILAFAGTFIMGDLAGALLLGPILLLMINRRVGPWPGRAPGYLAALALSTLALVVLLRQSSAPLLLAVPALLLLSTVLVALRYGLAQLTVLQIALGATLLMHNTIVADTAFFGHRVESLLMMQASFLMSVLTSTLVSLHRQHLNEMLQREQRLREHFERTEEQAQIGSWHLDIVRNRLTWSRQTYAMFGLDPKTFTPSYEHFLTLVHPDDAKALDQAWEDALHGAPYDHSHRIVVDGKIRWLRERAEFEFDAQRRPVAAWGSVQDVTYDMRLKALQRERDRAEAANQAKSHFLATLSHEIRTPLNGVIGLADLLGQKDLDDATRQSYLDHLKSSAVLLNQIVSDVLDLSKIESGRLKIQSEDYNLGELLQAVCDGHAPLAAAKGLSMELRLEPGAAQTLHGDPLRVRQILNNYLSNALKFTQRGGIIIWAGRDAEQIEVRVQDTGIGIGGADIDRLFQPFVQADESSTRAVMGTGLGLAICRELAGLMDGTVGVRSKPGLGSEFWVRLPWREAQMATAEAQMATAPKAAETAHTQAAPWAGQAAASPTVPDLQGVRILLAEDNPINTLVAVRMLERMGAIVTAVSDGQAALAALGIAEAGSEASSVEPAPARGTQPSPLVGAAFDGVLMDVHMPKLDGLAAARSIRAHEQALQPPRHLPVIAMTAGALAEQRQEALEAGMDDFLSKPIDSRRLREILVQHLQRGKGLHPDRPPGQGPWAQAA